MRSMAIGLLTALWIVSVFSVAHWRHLVLADREGPALVMRDGIVQAYLKGSGTVYLIWLLWMLP